MMERSEIGTPVNIEMTGWCAGVNKGSEAGAAAKSPGDLNVVDPLFRECASTRAVAA